MVQDYYFILEVEADADLSVIKTSYRRLAKKYHPDLNPSHDAQERMKALTEAYSVLSDAHKRALYDRKRTARSRAHASSYDEPPPRSKRRSRYEGIRLTESQIADALRLSKINLILTSSLLQRRIGLDYDHAAKLFEILIKRGYVDEDGRWTAKARRATSSGDPSGAKRDERKKKTTHAPPAGGPKPRAHGEEFRINETLMSRAIKISRTNFMLTVSLLQKRLGLDHARATRLYTLLEKRGYIDDIGVWTDEARARAKGTGAPTSSGTAK